MKLIVGLGNPGARYLMTRHNAGFTVVDGLALSFGMSWRDEGRDSFLTRGKIGDAQVVLAKPQTYMNESGRAVASLLPHLGLTLKDMVVVHDDIDLPLGTIRFKMGGGDAGHKGIISIVERVADTEFGRLRIGVDRPPPVVDPADYVLTAFSPDEMERFSDVVVMAQEGIVCLLAEGLEAAMTRFNR